uniref:Uncharacterized protein n=1 Tax=Romanomermis culicivorax TaxID=13658 RepID=A0A915KJW0_ROMCU
MKPAGPATKFSWPEKNDDLWISKESIVRKMAEGPVPYGTQFFTLTKEICAIIQPALSEFIN